MAFCLLLLLDDLIDQCRIGSVASQVMRLASQLFDDPQRLQGGDGTSMPNNAPSTWTRVAFCRLWLAG